MIHTSTAAFYALLDRKWARERIYFVCDLVTLDGNAKEIIRARKDFQTACPTLWNKSLSFQVLHAMRSAL